MKTDPILLYWKNKLTFFSRSNVNEYTKVNYTLIPLTEEAEENLAQAYQIARSGGSKEITAVDESQYVSAYTTINWTDVSVGPRNYVYLTSVTGGFSAEGTGAYIASGVRVNKQEITIGQTGFTAEGFKNQYTSPAIETNVRSFSYGSSNFSNWLPVDSDSGETNMGIYYVITLTRGTSTWTCEISNNY